MRYLITGGAGFIGPISPTSCSSAATRSTSSTTFPPARSRTSGTSRTGPASLHDRLRGELTRGRRARRRRRRGVPPRRRGRRPADRREPVRTIETNVHCTEVVLAQASKKKKPVFIASTSEVYGKSVDLPYREDGDLTLGPTVKGRWSYACSKAIDEFLAIAHWKERRLPTVIGRLFNTVGPRHRVATGW